MVQQHVRGAQALAAGIAALPDTRSSASYTQAAWRFLNNPRVTLPELARPLLSAAGPLLDEHCERYGLVMHDWSRVNFGGHASKVDRRQMTHKTDVGYDLQSSVLVSDVSGKPLAPVVHNLVNDTQVYSTMHKRPRPCEKHLDELSARLDWIDARGWNKPLIHIVDREADSVAHWREWSAQGRCFLIRAKNAPAVYFEGQQVKPMDLAERLTYQRAGDVLYKGRPACQSVAEVRVVITRKAKPAQKVDGKRVAPFAGKPLALRLVVSRIHDAQGKLLAQWLLLTNAPDAVDAQTIARWYYYRWQIESMFKLLKGAGQQMEDWLQDDAMAIAKRLVVASCACVLVWQLAAATSPQALEIQDFLVRISGRQTKRTKPVTAPALLNGLWLLLSTLTLLEHYDIDQLKQYAQFVFPNRHGP
jgi:Transposase DDE domain